MDRISGRILLNGIQQFYGLRQHSEMLIIGHSHIMLALDKDKLEKDTKMKVSKYTREGVSVYDRYYMAKQFLDSPYSDSLKITLYGVDRFSFVESGLSQNAYKLFYPFMEESIIDTYIKENVADTWDYYCHKYIYTTRYSDALLNASLRGYRNDFSNYKIGQLDVNLLRKQLAGSESQFNREIEMDSTLIDIFEKTIRMLTDRGIRVILINTPVVDLLSFGSQDMGSPVIQYFSDFTATHPNVEYWDFNPEYASDYSIFYDPIHLNTKGQQCITEKLVDCLNQLKVEKI